VSIEVNNESGVELDETVVCSVARHTLDTLEINPLAELSILIVDAQAMASLHKQWMDLDGPTDVMAFPMDTLDVKPGMGPDPGPTLLGDVILCPEVAAEQAVTAGHSTESELILLTTHGVLHLLGYDHDEPEDEREMFDLQAKLVTQWASAHSHEPVRTPLPGTAGELRG
jgi:probable rRNA maturation factor